jgi:ribose transport system permease protein
MLSGIPVWIALIITLLLGTFIGFINGILIARFGLSFVIATLGMMSILRGLVMVITHGVPFFGLQIPSFQYLAQGYIGPIPFPIILTGILLAFCMIIMNKAKLGRYVLSVGSNEQAAGLVGIQIRKVKILVYSMSGLFSAISGILLTSRMEAAMPEAGTGWELDVIAATIIGGTSLSGGKGNLLGTVVGALMMAVVRNGLNLLEVNVFWHQTVIGVIIIIAVAIDRISQTAKIRKKQIAS